MTGIHNFRAALNGFNRQDVVQYIEYINNTHNAQVNQLNSQIQSLTDELARSKAAPVSNELQLQLDTALARIQELEAQLAAASTQAPQNTELEAYRRAERAERRAQERAAQIYAQANAALAEATAKVEGISSRMEVLAQQVSDGAEASKAELQEAVAALYAIRPEEE